VEREYDIFEKLPDGAVLWRDWAFGIDSAVRRVRELATATVNECYAMHTPTKEIVARANAADEGRSTARGGA
jgi:hypothetical protein